MKLNDIQTSYNIIISLGSECGPSLHLKRHHLRKTSLPLDWVCSHSLTGVTRLFKNKFHGYMELNNMMKVVNYKPVLELDEDEDTADSHMVHDVPCDQDEQTQAENSKPIFVLNEDGDTAGFHSQLIKDNEFNVLSVHDFPIDQDWQTFYPSYKQKLTKRIDRLFDLLNNSPSILFIRWSNIFNEKQIRREAAQLEAVLSEVVKGEFKLLLIIPANGVSEIQDREWGLKNVCAVQVPLHTNPVTDEATWDYLLRGISLK